MSDAPEWQRGYDLETLRSLAEPFRVAYKPFVFGAFGCPKERDIAAAMAERRLVWTSRNGKPVAVAIFKEAMRPRKITTLAGEQAVAAAGDLIVDDLAWMDGAVADDAAATLLRHLLGWRSGAVWWRLNQEDVRHRVLAEALGGAWVGTAVAAGSELRGWWLFGGRDMAVTAFPAEDCPSMALLRDEFLSPDEQAAVLAELSESGPEWGDHYSSYNKRHSWSAIALKGYVRDDPAFIIKPDEMSKSWQSENAALLSAACVWTVAAERLPLTMSVVARLPGGERNRVRVMRLSASGELSRHADVTNRQAGTRPGALVRLHVPLQTNESVQFQTWDATGRQHRQHMTERALWYLDQRKPHACRNDGGHERLHLVADVEATDEIRDALASAWREGCQCSLCLRQ